MTGVEKQVDLPTSPRTAALHLAIGPMSRVSFADALVGPYGLRAVFAIVLALFAAFIYVFNFTSFF